MFTRVMNYLFAKVRPPKAWCYGRSFMVALVAAVSLGVVLPLPLLAQSPTTPTSALAAGADEPRELQLNQPVESEISAGQRQHWRLSLTPSQYLRIEVKQNGTDLGLQFKPPNGPIVDAFMPFGGPPILSFSSVADAAGTGEFTVYSASRGATGRYVITLVELRPASERDLALHRAALRFNEYVRLRNLYQYPEAIVALKQSLAIREQILGPDDPLVAVTVGHLAASLAFMGDYAKAETLDLQALEIREKAEGPDHPDVALELLALGTVYMDKGDDAKAEAVDLRALGIYERANQTETPQVASLLGALGEVYNARGDFTNASIYFERSRAVWEKLVGPDKFHLAPSYTYLGHVAYSAGDYAKAEIMYKRALSLVETALGPESLNLTRYLNNLAGLYIVTGRLDEAEALYRRALANHEKRDALGYPAIQETLWGLGRLNVARGRVTQAVQLQTRATAADEQYATMNFAIGSEREKLSIASVLYERMSQDVSLHVEQAPNDPAARDLALTSILQRKGRVQDAVSSGLDALRSRFSAEDRQLLDQLNDVTGRLAFQVLGRNLFASPADHRDQIKQLEDQKEKLEQEISIRSSGYFQPAPAATLAAIRAAVPPDAALIEFAVFRPFDPKARDDLAYGDPRYVAYVVRDHGEVQWRDLGPVARIDEAIVAWRRALGDAKSTDVDRLGRAVDAMVMQPLRPLAGDATQLLISPDGELNLMPFAALKDEQDRYLIQRYAFTFLASGRDLLHSRSQPTSKNRPLVIANPTFGEPLNGSGLDTSGNKVKSTTRRRSVTAARDLSGVYFAPLAGTGREADAILALFPDTTVLTGPAATKSAMMKVTAPSILHIATHGFFLADLGGRAAVSNGTIPNGGAPNQAGWTDNPLLRSGLALADANVRDGGHDGILTALEATGLNLWGTKLVVLSACDTGLGEIRNGEGVYGLRRAFYLAGAESMVMSLWQASDLTTRKLMTEYYRYLKQGAGRGAALRQVQLEMLRRDPQLHPFYWASFIQSGEWANLDGKR
jgi:CHAT domain-containing protein/Tfp pilus assembly protein PilF